MIVSRQREARYSYRIRGERTDSSQGENERDEEGARGRWEKEGGIKTWRLPFLSLSFLFPLISKNLLHPFPPPPSLLPNISLSIPSLPLSFLLLQCSSSLLSSSSHSL